MRQAFHRRGSWFNTDACSSRVVPLSEGFRKYLEESIHGIIMGIPSLKKEYPKFKNDWKYENEFDFMYGCIVGQILGTSLTAFKMIHNREAKSDEILMIGELVESYFPLIRDEIRKSENGTIHR